MQRINGTAGLFLYKHLIGEADSPDTYVKVVEIIENGKARKEDYYVVPFDDKNKLAWYYPNQSKLKIFPSK